MSERCSPGLQGFYLGAGLIFFSFGVGSLQTCILRKAVEQTKSFALEAGEGLVELLSVKPNAIFQLYSHLEASRPWRQIEQFRSSGPHSGTLELNFAHPIENGDSWH